MSEYRDIVETLFGRTYQYATLSSLEGEGLSCGSESTDMLTNARALALIKLYSLYINDVTGQWFEPFKLTFGMTMKRESVFSLPNRIPILLLSELLDNGTAISEGNYRVNVRNIELSSISNSDRLSNYQITGVFGWLEDLRFLETTAVAVDPPEEPPAEPEEDEVTYFDVPVTTVSPGHLFTGISGVGSSFKPKDVVIFEDSDGIEIGRRILLSVDKEENILRFEDFDDSEESFTVAEGTVVKTYGRVPNIIELATIQFVVDNYNKKATNESIQEQIRRRIKSEKTDSYSYDTHTMKGGGGYAVPDPTLTSNSLINRALQRFAAPGWVRNL